MSSVRTLLQQLKRFTVTVKVTVKVTVTVTVTVKVTVMDTIFLFRPPADGRAFTGGALARMEHVEIEPASETKSD